MISLTVLAILIVSVAAGGGRKSGLAERCDRQARDERFDSSERCEVFQDCCREQCLQYDQNAVQNTCDNQWYETKEKACRCGGNSFHQGVMPSTSELKTRCDRAARKKFHDRDQCDAFMGCCRAACRNVGRNTGTNRCDDRFYNSREKICQCGRPQHFGGGNRSRKDECKRLALQREIMSSDQCHAFKNCCRERCGEDGLSAMTNKCSDTWFEDRPITCICGRY